MTTDCIPHQLEFQGLTRRTVVASFDGGTLSSDGGVLLLAAVDRRFSSVAYVLLNELRRLGLTGTDLAQARCDTIRTKLLKIGAQVKVTVRRVCVHLASSYPYATLFAQVLGQLRASRPALS